MSPTPIPHIYDVPDPTTELLDLGVFSRGLSRLVVQYLERTKGEDGGGLVSNHAFVVGIHGPWGSGKSTLMEKVGADLEKRYGKDELLIVPFQAWRYNKREVLWRALLSRVVEKVEAALPEEPKRARSKAERERVEPIREIHERCNTIRQKLYRDYEHTTEGATSLKWSSLPSLAINLGLSWLTPNPANMGKAASGLVDLFERKRTEEFHARLRDLDQFEEEFSWLRVKSGRHWVILIDDLDRCLPESAIEIFEATKVFLDVSSVVFLVALDKETIRRGLRVRYGEKEGEKPLIDPDLYIEKVTNISFVLPTLSRRESVRALIEGIIQDRDAHLNRAETTNPKTIATMLNSLLDHQQRHMQPNPRRWIRLLNTALLYDHMRDGLGEQRLERRSADEIGKAFLKFLCLSYRWGGFMEAALNSWEIMVTFEQAAAQAERSFEKFQQICCGKYPKLRAYAEDADLFQLLLTEPKLSKDRAVYDQVMRLF